MSVLNKKKKTLALAVANASMAVALDVSAEIMVTNGNDDGPNSLRAAIAAASDGEQITFSADVSTITLDAPLVVTDKSLVIANPVDDDGAPEITIMPSSDGIRLLELNNTSSELEDALPFIISGLKFTGADIEGRGGAILAENHTLVLHKSVITGNDAVGVGGGVAVEAGELCLQGSELSDNTVTGDKDSEGFYAIGGGAAVNGILNVLPARSDDDEVPPGDVPDCLISKSARDLFGLASPEMRLAAESLAAAEDGPGILASRISGNTAEVMADVTINDKRYIALGGGLAVLKSNLNQEDSALIGDLSCKYGGFFGPGPEDRQCSLVLGSAITGNEAKLNTTQIETHESRYSLVSGGGIFLGMPGIEQGMLLSTKYADISDNEATLEGAGAALGDFVVGGGIGGLRSDLPFEVSDFWDTIIAEEEEIELDPDPVCLDDPKYCAIQVIMGATTVTGNTATLDLDDSQGEFARDLIAGGGIGSLTLFSSSDPDDFSVPSVQSFFSSVSGNTVDAKVEEEFFAALGGGVAAGMSLLEEPEESSAYLEYGKYIGFFSGNSDNEVLVAGAAGKTTTGIAGGGGVNAAFNLLLGKKPEFAIITDEEPEEKYGLELSEALFASPGGVADNSVEVTAAPGEELFMAVAGGGLLSNSKYSFLGTVGTVISGNGVTVNAATSAGLLGAAGGGAAAFSLLGGPDSRRLSFLKYSALKDNSVSVTGGSSLGVSAVGGGLAVTNSGFGLDEVPAEDVELILAYSEVSGNTLELTSTNVESSVRGGGVFATGVTGVYDDCCGDDGDPDDFKYIANIFASTIAGNSLSMSGAGGTVWGAGLWLGVDYDDSDTGGIVNATIAGNTGSRAGAPLGGQLVLEVDEAAEDGFKLHNTLISGETAQGTSDIYYNEEPDVEATAVFHRIDGPPAGFLAAAIADPTFLDVLQFNGSYFIDEGGEIGGKYGFVHPTATIALLPGSGAINPMDGGCVSAETPPFDQRAYPRDECPDLGAYERMAEQDGDGLVDDTELGAPATDPEILVEEFGYNGPRPYGLLASGDGNSDGIPDVDQAHVASFTSESAGALTLYVLRGPDLGEVTPAPGLIAGGFDMSLGGVSFTVLTGDTNEENPETVELALIAPASGPLQLVKQVCNPLPANPEEGWTVLDASPEPFGPGRVRFTFELEEGGPFDCNGDDPDIVDPVYIAKRPSAIPTLPAAMYAVLSGALGVLGLFGLRSRKKKPRR
jgi:hypothetical protein